MKPPSFSSFTGVNLPFVGFTYTKDRFVIVLSMYYLFIFLHYTWCIYFYSKYSDTGCINDNISQCVTNNDTENIDSDTIERCMQKLKSENHQVCSC